MQTQKNAAEVGHEVPSGEAELPLYRSRYGGLWVDRRDAPDILEGRRARGEISDADAEVLAHYIDHGYVVFPKAVHESVIDEFLAVFETAWNAPPDRIFLHCKGQYLRMDRKFYDEVSKVGEMHTCFERAGELIFPPPVLRFLTQIYERPPVAFQTMTMRKGSEESLHIDTGPLTLTEPMSMVACWLALEDVQPRSGEFQFIPGSHNLPELLHHGTDKGHGGDYQEYDKVLKATLRMCEERGLETKTFMAKKGDVLVWHADLMHGGAPIQDRQQTRKSLVSHIMPFGVMPTFFDSSEVSAIRYARGGYHLDARWNAKPSRQQQEDVLSVAQHGKARPIDLWREWVPLRVRERVPSSFAAWARRQVSHSGFPSTR
jgi:phytanoyl-CoA hydroxylase